MIKTLQQENMLMEEKLKSSEEKLETQSILVSRYKESQKRFEDTEKEN